MINKLRNKFIIIMMSIVALILSAILFTMYTSTKNSLERTSTSALFQELNSLDQVDKHDTPPKGFDGLMKSPGNFRLPTLLVEISEDGSFKIAKNHIYSIEDIDLEYIVEEVSSDTKEFGVISDYNLRFLKKDREGTLFIAFVDTSVETQTINSLLLNSLLVGFVSLLVFLVLSIFLAKWAISPVKLAWERQKQFVADASHELKTPLTVILSNAEMLSHGSGASTKESSRLENILAEGQRMKNLIENMLALARSDYSDNKKVYSLVSLSEIVMNSVLLYESVVYDENKSFEYDITAGIFIKGDEEKLRQLVDILLDNAKKFTEENKMISLKLFTDLNKEVHLTVFNEGNPIANAELENIFRRFYRTDSSRQNNGGFGLGLAIADSIVNEHGGKIWAENYLNTGNLFHVVFNYHPTPVLNQTKML